MKNKYKAKYTAKLRPLHHKLTSIDRQRSDCNEYGSVYYGVNQSTADMWKIATLSATAAFLLYINTIFADFAYDDSRAILKNQDLKPETPIANIWYDDFWGTPLTHSGSHKSYRPLVVLTFRLNYALHQLNPGGYHFINVLLHMLATFIYTVLIALVSKRTFVTLIAGILFAIHPIHTEAVAGIVGRADVLCAVFFCASLLSFIKYCQQHAERDNRRYLWIALTLALITASTLSKELGITAIGVCAVYYIFHHSKLSLKQLLQPDKMLELSEPVGLLGVYGVVLLALRLYFMGYSPPNFSPADNPAADSDSLLTRMLTFLYLPAFNFLLLVFPVTLSFDWSMGAIPLVDSLTDSRVIFIVFFYAGLAWLVKYSLSSFYPTDGGYERDLPSTPRNYKNAEMNSHGVKMNNGEIVKNGSIKSVTHRRSRKDSSSSSESVSYDENQNELCGTKNSHRHKATIILSLAMTILPFLPASNLFFYVGFVVAERVLYICSMGFCLLVAEILYQLHKQFKHHHAKKLAFHSGLVLVGVLLSLRCYYRCLDWRTEEQLYRSGIGVNPAKSWGNLANVLNNNGDVAGAEAAYRSALSHRGNMADVHYNLGILLQGQNRYTEALEEYNMAISCRPRLTVAHLNKGIVLALLGQHNAAIKAYKETTSIDTTGLKDPRMHETAKISALYNLGRLYAERKDYQSAISTYKLALERRPEYYAPPSIYNLLGEAYFYSGDIDNAQWAYQKSLHFKPDHLPAHLTMARLMNVKKQLGEAEGWYKKALQIDSKDTQNYYHYALFLSEHSRHTEALDLWKKAVQLSPADFDIVFNFATNLRQLGHNQQALVEYERAVTLSPTSATAHMNLGAMYHITKDYIKAEKSYTKALQLDPTNEITQNNLRKLQKIKQAGKS